MGLSCPVCGGPLDAPGVCRACRAAIVPSRVGQAIYLGRYAQLSGLVRAAKYRRNRVALVWAGERLAAAARSVGWPVEAVTFVPTFFWRAMGRGQYPPAVLARILSRELGVAYRPLLVRYRYTPSQTRRHDRHRLPQLFVAKPPVPKKLLLVDDVLTSGATFHRAVEALFEAGADRVWGAFLAVVDPERLRRLPYNRPGAR